MKQFEDFSVPMSLKEKLITFARAFNPFYLGPASDESIERYCSYLSEYTSDSLGVFLSDHGRFLSSGSRYCIALVINEKGIEKVKNHKCEKETSGK